MDLKEKLIKYKDLTLELIGNAENGDYDSLDKILASRQNVMDEIDNMTFSKEEFLCLCKELDILVLNEKLVKITQQKKADISNNIDRLKDSKTANKSYNKRFSVDPVFFNKKI